MAQTIEDFVGKTLDDAPVTSTHVKVVALIAAGYFFDVIDFVIYGSLIPDMLKEKFATQPELAWVGSAQLFGLFIGTFFQGQFTDRIGRKSVYQFNLLLFGVATIAAAFAPDATWLAVLRFIAGIGLGAEQPLCFAYAGEYAPKRIRGRILAIVHFIGGALVWPLAALITLYLRDMPIPAWLDLFHTGTVGWRGIWTIIGIGALIVFLLRFSLPESPRWLATHGKGDRALDVLAKMGLPGPKGPLTSDAASDTKSDPFVVVWRDYPVRVLAGMVCFSAFFGVAIGLGTWLPNIMNEKGFTITKSLWFTFGVACAVPCASLFMMYALDNIGRKRTATIAFIFAGIMAIAFALAQNDLWLLVAGYLMVFGYQVAGNSVQIFASEVFPTNARASGFGMAAGIGRLATAGIIPLLPWIKSTYGLPALFGFIAAVLVIASTAVHLMGPETKGRGLDDVAAPTG